MQIKRFAMRCEYALIAAVIGAASWPSDVGAQALSESMLEDHEVHQTAAYQLPTAEGKDRENALVRLVREVTDPFRDVSKAVAAGYFEQFGCVSGSDQGAMGVHFVNDRLVDDDVLDPAHPELLVYEPTPGGGLQLVAADYLVLADKWNASHNAPPQLMGQLFHLFESPNRFGLPAFYTLHVWAWKENRHGTFVNWNPDVSCDHYAPSAP